jgi:valyl-tRNA synthetase
MEKIYMEIEKNYHPQTIEKKWYTYWVENNFFTPTIDELQKPFTIVIPPPNVTGILHMGHVLNNTLQDIAVRYHRMTGRPTLWIPGTDHAGIATQNVVEKELAKENQTRHTVGREALVKKIWQYKEQKGSHIIEQLKQLGCSCDWSRERFTMDAGLSEAVREVFVCLYEQNLIYKGKFIINWCPRCMTALANDEVEYIDKKGKLWYVRYPLESSDTTSPDGDSAYIVIATTRPETILGDVAVAVNPKDERYAHLIGKYVLLPVCDRKIPIIADSYVDKDFGSGCVKITPAHDPNDFEVGIRHDLPQLTIMDANGQINENAPKRYQGLDRFVAREQIVKELTDSGLIHRIEDHDNSVGHCYRCDTIVEPYLSDQWFVRMKPLAVPAIKAVEAAEIKILPDRWTKVYMHWMNNIRDWCISRQIWWGHRIPAYYCTACEALHVNKVQPDTCTQCSHDVFRQDEDVLDTWFSSWLWPFSTMGWPEKTPDLAYFLPTNLLVTAPEIIYLWVARMIMATLHFQGKIPFDTVLLHGIVRDELGRKLEKSKGNSPDPIDIIEKVGADALRFSIIFNTPKGQDSYYSNAILESGRNFCNKIWNAFRFIMMNIEKIDGLPTPSDLKMDLADLWIYSRLHQTTQQTDRYYQEFDFNQAAQTLMHFIWDDFCSWYVEMAKEKLYGESDIQILLTTKYVILDIMQSAMRLLHPIMPFITEEIWQKIKEIFPISENALIIAKFPQADEKMIDHDIVNAMKLIQDTIVAIRNLRKQINVSPAKNVDIAINLTSYVQIDLYEKYKPYICKLAKVENVSLGISVEKPPLSMIATVSDIKIYLLTGGLIAPVAEKEKLQKQVEKLQKELQGIVAKLENEKFLSGAKPEIIAKEKEKKIEVESKLKNVIEAINSF